MSVTTIPNTGLDVPNYGDTNYNTLWGTMTIAVLSYLGNQIPRVLCAVALSDETTAITTGTAKVTIIAPQAWVISEVIGSLTTASSSGTPTFDINENGSSILSTKITIDANETSSLTAATAPVISDANVAKGSTVTFDIDVAGTGATGAKIYIIGKIA